MPQTDRATQVLLNSAQVAEFYHDLFVETQVRHFSEIARPRLCPAPGRIVDIGGGCGHFASAIERGLGLKVKVIDLDPTSVQLCAEKGINAVVGDALFPPIVGDEEVACFNLVLHHLVAKNDTITSHLQAQALDSWRGKARFLFVNEYIYDSYLGSLSSHLIYRITSSRVLSQFGRIVSRFVPSLRANTFGVGVRFRSRTEWLRFFDENGWKVAAMIRGVEEPVSIARRLLLIRSCRRDSFVLIGGV